MFTEVTQILDQMLIQLFKKKPLGPNFKVHRKTGGDEGSERAGEKISVGNPQYLSAGWRHRNGKQGLLSSQKCMFW